LYLNVPSILVIAWTITVSVIIFTLLSCLLCHVSCTEHSVCNLLCDIQTNKDDDDDLSHSRQWFNINCSRNPCSCAQSFRYILLALLVTCRLKSTKQHYDSIICISRKISFSLLHFPVLHFLVLHFQHSHLKLRFNVVSDQWEILSVTVPSYNVGRACADDVIRLEVPLVSRQQAAYSGVIMSRL